MYISVVNRFQLISQPVSYAIDQNPIFPGGIDPFAWPFLCAEVPVADPLRKSHRAGMVCGTYTGAAGGCQPAPGDHLQGGQRFSIF